MNIIEKLGITPIRIQGEYGAATGNVNKIKIRELEQQRNEMLDALIKAVKEPVKFSWHTDDVIKIIEKATGKTWKKIKELL